jgi:hypothetical protein
MESSQIESRIKVNPGFGIVLFGVDSDQFSAEETTRCCFFLLHLKSGASLRRSVIQGSWFHFVAISRVLDASVYVVYTLLVS